MNYLESGLVIIAVTACAWAWIAQSNARKWKYQAEYTEIVDRQLNEKLRRIHTAYTRWASLPSKPSTAHPKAIIEKAEARKALTDAIYS